MQKTSSTWFAIAVLAFFTVVIFSKFLFSDMMLFSSDQMAGIDSKVFLKDALQLHLQFPWWFSTRLSGMPTIDALFGEAFYFPSILLLMITSVAKYIGIKMVLHIFLAGLFFYLMLKKSFRMNQLVSITGALFYMFNPQFFSHIYPGHDGKMFVIAWLPFIIWQLKNLMETPKVISMILLGIGIGMSILSSQLQMTYFVLWGAFLYWIVASVLLWLKTSAPRQIIIRALCFWGAVLVGVGVIGSVQIFPSALYIRDAFSVRGVERGFDFAASWSLHWPEFFSLWVPELANTLDYYWGQNPFKLNSEYAGMIPLLLATGAVAVKPKNKWRIFWAAIAFGTALFALGAHTPLFHLAYAIIPGVKKFRAASMIMFWFSFSTILLSTLFLKDLSEGYLASLDEQIKKKVRKTILIIGICFIAITLLFSVKGIVKNMFSDAVFAPGKETIFELNYSRNFLPFLWLWLIFSLGTLTLIYTSVTGRFSSLITISILLAIGLIDILRVDTRFIKLVSPKPYFQTDTVFKNLSEKMEKEPFRCFSLPGALPRNGEGIHGLEGIGGFHDNELHWYREFRGNQQDINYLSSLIATNANGQPYLRSEMLSKGNPFLNIANARYCIARNGSKLMAIENTNVLGRVSYVPNDTIIDSASIIPALTQSSYDYRKMVALTTTPQLPEGFSPPSMDRTTTNDVETKWDTYTPNYRKVTVTLPADGFLRISEVFYEGWKIFINGKSTPYYRSDLSWMAVPLKAGTYTLEMRAHSAYLSKTLLLGWAVLVFVIIPGILLWPVVSSRIRRDE